MLRFLGGRAAERKLRLFACGCARQVWHLLASRRSRRAVEVAELHADGRVGSEDLRAAWHAALDFARRNARDPVKSTAAAAAAAAARPDAEEAAQLAAWAAAWVTGYLPAATSRRAEKAAARSARSSARARQATLVRCLFGNPFRRADLYPRWLAWRDGLLAVTARRMYDARDFANMPRLGDLLREAGCANAQLLAHCRRPGPHTRGCFVVDGLLGLT
jgi:hypothetical protein